MIVYKSSVLIFLLGSVLISTSASSQTETDYILDRIEGLVSSSYEHKMISSGNNFPSINLRAKNRTEVLILLAEGLPLNSITKYYNWSDVELQERLDELQIAGLVKRTADGSYVPTLALMSVERVAKFMSVSDEIVNRTVEIIDNALPSVLEQYSQMRGFDHVPFEHASLLILSDVLLDNWQINSVEEQFLKSERPLRNGSRYYYSLQEKPEWRRNEAFGIYGNQYRGFNGITVGVYGNHRSNNPQNFLDLNTEQVFDLFGIRSDSVRAFKRQVVASVVNFAREGQEIDAQLVEGLRRIGWLENGNVILPVLTKSENSELSAMAEVVTDEILNLLSSERFQLESMYHASPYSIEITFEEYFIWWYHVYYSKVTDKLIDQGAIAPPASGIISFVIAD